MKIYLIRHGETDWNHQGRLQGREDVALNENGMKQATLCGRAFQGKNIKTIITSPLIRARKTAEVISEEINADTIIIEEALIERDYGKLSGLTFDRKKYYDTFGTEEGLEPWEDLTSRLMSCLERYAKAYEMEDILMVSHGGAINSILAVLSQGEIGTGKTRLKNTCINSIICKEGAFELERINLTAEEFRQGV